MLAQKNSVIGIVAEYNPFHKGHSYQINKARSLIGDVPVIAVMSGSFTQRGEAAILDKWTRARLAIVGGIDLVLELPAIYACRSSEKFALGAVGTLAATGLVTHLAFGTETKNPDLLASLAQKEINKSLLKEYLKTGLTYGAAVEKTLGAEKFNKNLGTLLKGSNNILALEYYRSLNKLASDIIPLPLTRHGAEYKSLSLKQSLPSATAIRAELLSRGCTQEAKNALPEPVTALLSNILQQQKPGVDEAKVTLLLNYILSTYTPAKLKLFCDCSEGLENKMVKAAGSKTLEQIVAAIKSKRYPATRIQRLLCQLLISTDEVPFSATAALSPSYIRVLAFNERGQQLLRKMKKTASLPILNKLGKNIFTVQDNTAFALTLKTEIAATNLYDLLAGTGYYNRDFLQSSLKVKA